MHPEQTDIADELPITEQQTDQPGIAEWKHLKQIGSHKKQLQVN